MIINRDAIYMLKMQKEKLYNKKAIIMISVIFSLQFSVSEFYIHMVQGNTHFVKLCVLKQQK